MKPRYAVTTHDLSSPRARRLLRGSRDETEFAIPSWCGGSVADRIRRFTRDHDDSACDALNLRLLVRWTVQHRRTTHGAHYLHQPVIVGLILPRRQGEPVRSIHWGTRARRIALAALR